MYRKEFTIGDNKFIFLLKNQPYFEASDTIVLGYPYNMNINTFSEKDVDKVKGYYVYIKYEKNLIKIINDLCGLCRLYYLQEDNIVYFSDDFMTLFNQLPIEKRTPDLFAIEYWHKHRYTPDNLTFLKAIRKIKPSNIYKFEENKMDEQLYYKDITNIPNKQNNYNNILQDLRNSISIIKEIPKKKFVLFSGGADSTLIVKLLQEQNVEFVPVFAKHIPTNSMNYDDILKVKQSSKLLNIETQDVIIDTNQDITLEYINDCIIDRANIRWTYNIINELKNKYGEDIILITGEAADSILNFGPTGYSFGDYISRNIMFNNKSLYTKCLFKILQISREYYRNMEIPKNEEEYFQSFLDEKFYKVLNDKSKTVAYKNNLYNIVKKYSNILKSKYALMMYLKISSFIQGSDQQVFINPSNYFGIKLIFLFATPQIMYSTVKNTDYKYEINHPKSVVYKILKDVFNYEMPNIKKVHDYKKNKKQYDSIGDYESKIHNQFFERFKELNFSEKVDISSFK